MKSAFLIIAILFGLAACNTPGPHFRGLTATRIEVDGSLFDVRIRGEMAEAMRLNFEYAPCFGPIRNRAALAMGAVSGCMVRDVLGDQALATGVLDCRRNGPQARQTTPTGCVEGAPRLTKSHDPPVRTLSCGAPT